VDPSAYIRDSKEVTMDTEYHTYAIGDRLMTNHGVGTVKDFELDGNGFGRHGDRVIR